MRKMFALAVFALLLVTSQVAVATNAQLRFAISTGVTEANELMLREQTQLALEYTEEVLGVDDLGFIRIIIRGPNDSIDRFAAQALPHKIEFHTGSPVWEQNGEMRQRQSPFHEMFHVVQFSLAHSTNGQLDAPIWMVEGSAVYIGFAGMIWIGESTERDSYLLNLESAAYGSELGTLESLEDDPDYFSYGNAYALSYLAIDMLMRDHEVSDLVSFYRDLGAGSTWQEAFEANFDQTIETFYEAFEAERVRVGA